MSEHERDQVELESGESRPESERTPPLDRAERAGLPPDSGPEVRVRLIRPSMLRGRPFSTVGLVLLPFVIAIGAKLLFDAMRWWPHATITFLVLAAICWFTLFLMWLQFGVARSLEITNKRVVERRGIFSRSTDEVLHDHIRNITVNQTFFERIMGVGEIGISSAGQAGVEIDMRDIPDPDGVKEIIDAYRPL